MHLKNFNNQAVIFVVKLPNEIIKQAFKYILDKSIYFYTFKTTRNNGKQ